METDKRRDETLVICKDCGKDVPKDWRFCIMCGAQLVVENQQHKSEANTPQNVEQFSVEVKVESTIEVAASDTVAVVTGDTAEVTPSDIEESIEEIASEPNKPLASPTTSGKPSSSVKWHSITVRV